MSEFTSQNDLVLAELTDAELAEITETDFLAQALVGLSDEVSGADVAGNTDDDSSSDDAADADAAVSTDGDAVAFTELGLPEALVKKLAEKGVQTAFPIQAATIPDALAGRHVLGKARTGSGKTLAFGLAALANLNGRRARKGKPLALVLVPTRELAMQVTDALQPYGYAVGADIAAVYGGAPMYKQVFALRRGVEVLVATPGRLTDLIEQEECDLSEVAIAILDEADQMADMGFMPIVSELLSQTDPAGQRLLFSATLDGAVDELVRQYLHDPVVHSVTEDDEDPIRMDHHLLIVEPTEKALITAEIAARHTPGDDARRTILFARTKLGADRIAEKIREHGVSALALHGGMTQRARTKTLADFKDGRVPVLVATDVAARGIHVDGIDLVLHVDPAGDPKDYLHRAGRTARAGEAGTVVTLVLPKQRKSTQRLLEQAGVEAALTKVAPSSDTLRSLTGGRPVAEYVAEADAYHAARRAARDARTGDEGRGGRDGFRGGRDGFRRDRGFGGDRDRGFGGERRSFDRDRNGGGERRSFDRGGSQDRGFGGDRSPNREFGGERRSFGNRNDRGGFNGDRPQNRETGGERRSFGDRGERGGFGGDRPQNRETGGERRSFGDRGERGGFGGDRSPNRESGGERRSFGDRNGSQDRGFDRNRPTGGQNRGFGDRDRSQSRESGERRSFDRNGSQGRDFGGDRGERRSFGDRNGSQDRGFDRNRPTGGQNRSFGDRDRSQSRESGGQQREFGGERRSFGDRNGSQDRGFDRNRPTGGQNRSFGDRDRSQGRDFGGDRGTHGDRRTFGDRNRSQDRGFDRDRPAGSGDRRTFGDRDTNGDRPQRTAFGRPRGGYTNDSRPQRDRRW